MQQGDLERLMAVWSDDEEIACVHPGGPRVVGPGAVRASFEAMFTQGGGVQIRLEGVRRFQTGSVAVHHVVERLQAMTGAGPRSAWVVATNVYVKAPQGWRMVLHHASPGSDDEMIEITESPATLH